MYRGLSGRKALVTGYHTKADRYLRGISEHLNVLSAEMLQVAELLLVYRQQPSDHMTELEQMTVELSSQLNSQDTEEV